MNLTKKILSILFSVYLLYKLKLDVINFFYKFRKRFISEEFINSFNCIDTAFFVVIYYSLCILFCVYIFYLISKVFTIDKFILLSVCISPILYDLSDIIYDKSCLKPWQRWDEFVWYFPIRVIIWSLVFLLFRKMIPMLKEKINLIMLSCVLALYVLVKMYSRYNF